MLWLAINAAVVWDDRNDSMNTRKIALPMIYMTIGICIAVDPMPVMGMISETREKKRKRIRCCGA